MFLWFAIFIENHSAGLQSMFSLLKKVLNSLMIVDLIITIIKCEGHAHDKLNSWCKASEGEIKPTDLSCEPDLTSRWQILLRVTRTGLGFNDSRCACNRGAVGDDHICRLADLSILSHTRLWAIHTWEPGTKIYYCCASLFRGWKILREIESWHILHLTMTIMAHSHWPKALTCLQACRTLTQF